MDQTPSAFALANALGDQGIKDPLDAVVAAQTGGFEAFQALPSFTQRQPPIIIGIEALNFL